MKTINNKILIGILIVLAAVFSLSRIFRSSQLQSNLRTELLQLDTASVTKLILYPKAENGKEIELIRAGKSWTVKKENRSANIEQGSVNNALATFVKLKPLRLVTKKKEKWSEYSVGDSGTYVKVFKGNDMVANMHIGRIGYNQSSGGQFNPGGVFTYVRLTNEDEVYAVEGFLESSFNRSYNDWRDKSFLRLKKDQITEIQFSYPADSSFALTKKDEGWWIGGELADSVKANSFLSQLEYKNATSFADDFVSSGPADVVVKINGISGSLATIEGWRRTSDWVLKSSWQSSINFSSENAGLTKVLFESKKNLLPRKK
jgi:Domain of unknown function (DUF4340)